jgi:DNA-binding IclR family transcriptional regulator
VGFNHRGFFSIAQARLVSMPPDTASAPEKSSMEANEQGKEPAARGVKEQRGIHAMEVGGTLLRHLADAGQPVSMAALSAATNLPLNQVFTYMVSLVRTGLVRRDATTHSYEPGPLSLNLGLRALAQVPLLKETVRRVADLASEANHGVLVAIWADRGPTVVRYLGPDIYMHTGLHVGAVMSIAHSSTGRLFAAFMPKEEVGPMLQRDISKRSGIAHAQSTDVVDDLLLDIRQRRLARTTGLPIPGIDSLSAPIFNRAGKPALAVTVFGPTCGIDVSCGGSIAERLSALTSELSASSSSSSVPM